MSSVSSLLLLGAVLLACGPPEPKVKLYGMGYRYHKFGGPFCGEWICDAGEICIYYDRGAQASFNVPASTCSGTTESHSVFDCSDVQEGAQWCCRLNGCVK